MKKNKIVFLLILGLMFICNSSTYAQQKKEIQLKGVVFDETKMTIPYASVGIPKKNIGTASNDDGGFFIGLDKSNLVDTLEISSIGFKTFKIKVEDYLNRKEKNIILKEDIVSLAEVKIVSPNSIVKNALKNLKKTTLSSKHQINMLYRRSSVENGKTRFLVEHYLKVFDYGPSATTLSGIEITEARKSADYRYVFRKQPAHSVNVMTQVDPIRQGISLKSYKWKKVDNTSYDGEELVIIEGTEKDDEKNRIKLYIGIYTYGIYKMELSRLNAVYIYKKDNNGKLVLSYHNREAHFVETIDDQKRKILNLKTPKVECAYRQEVIVLSVESDKKKFDIKNLIYDKKDIGDYDVKYNKSFWENTSLPPETAFYKKSVKELESIYGVPLETQFNAVNK
ncbi:carboxypeptidase-like regulatory domain-containing protein [Flavobacterium faecale]|uniref:carboxypeptidase-like regulatory domain-containing protein n=1 Tax=Flavobacterium faecale TaxID=1355330 RepID=UPI003AAC3FB3